MEFRTAVRTLIVSSILLVVLQPPCASGSLLTDRLSSHDLKVWNSILNIVRAKDRLGLSLHPRLLELWRSLEASAHQVHIEMIDQDGGYSSHAGRFTIEGLDPEGKRHICVIRLYLATIRKAYVGSSVKRSNGFVPMTGLRTTDRYAEVLGHEMAHALSTLQDPEVMQLFLEKEKEIADYERLLKSRTVSPGDLKGRLERIRDMQRRLEQPAEAAEADVWLELSQVSRRKIR